MKTPPNESPHWVTSFCCFTPFCALLIIAIGLVLGADIAVPIFGGMLWLCGRTITLVLGSP